MLAGDDLEVFDALVVLQLEFVGMVRAEEVDHRDFNFFNKNSSIIYSG